MSKNNGSIKLPNKIFTNGFNEALIALSSLEGLPNQFAWDVTCFIPTYMEKANAFSKKRAEILTKDCHKGEDGKPKITTDGGVRVYTYDDPELEAKAAKAEKDLVACDVTFKISKFKIHLNEFKTMPSPKHLHTLAGILDVRK